MGCASVRLNRCFAIEALRRASLCLYRRPVGDRKRAGRATVRIKAPEGGIHGRIDEALRDVGATAGRVGRYGPANG
jgi:hypothetical protein